MPSDKQTQANRQNASRSTGPRTPEGKARASLNAVRHGLLARQSVIPEEDRAQFLALLAALHAEHQPLGPQETYLVEQIASAQFRMERLTRIETGFFMIEMDKIREWDLREAARNTADDDDDDEDEDEDEDQEDDAEEDDAPPSPAPPTPDEEYDENTRLLGRVFKGHTGGDAFTRLARYETVIQRTFYRALKALLELQLRRTPPPAKQNARNEPKSPRADSRPEPLEPSLAAAPPPAEPNEPKSPASGPAPALFHPPADARFCDISPAAAGFHPRGPSARPAPLGFGLPSSVI
jgi:hypothetical protein